MRTTLANNTICSTDYSANVEHIIWHLYVLSESRPSGNVQAKQRAKKKSNEFCCHNIYAVCHSFIAVRSPPDRIGQ